MLHIFGGWQGCEEGDADGEIETTKRTIAELDS